MICSQERGRPFLRRGPHLTGCHRSESRLLLLLIIDQHSLDRSSDFALRVLNALRPETRDHFFEATHEGVLVGRGDS